MKPTVIGNGPAVPPSAPTVIGSKPGIAGRPTVLPGSRPGLTTAPQPQAQPPSPAPVATGPSATPAPVPASVSRLRGVERRPLRLDAGELAQRHPHAERAVLEQVVDLLSGVVPEAFSEADGSSFGMAAQRRYGELVARQLALMQADAVRDAPRHLLRLHALLESIGEALEPAGLLPFRRESARERLSEAQPEIAQLRQLLEVAAEGLNDTRAGLGELLRGSTELVRELTAGTLACDELAPRVGETQAALLIDRGLQLARSAALVQELALQTQRCRRELASLTNRIHDGVLIALPAWVTAVHHADPRPTDTQRYQLRMSLADLLQRLSDR